MQVTHVGVIQGGCDDPKEHNKPKEDVDLSPPRDHEGASDPGYLRPVERYDGQAHSRANAKELVDWNVVGKNPTYPREDRQRLEEVACRRKMRQKRMTEEIDYRE